jgi:hypothetical protein
MISKYFVGTRWQACILLVSFDLFSAAANGGFAYVSSPSTAPALRHFTRSCQTKTCLLRGIDQPGTARSIRSNGLVAIMARSQEMDEIVFVPGQTPKSQPRRGSGSRWEQWFGADELEGKGGKSSEGSEHAGADHTLTEPGKAVDNLRRLQSATYNSLDWKVRGRI